MKVDNLVLNTTGSVNLKDRVWRDDGLLPYTFGVYYAYGRHRPITGIEEFLLRGFPINKMNFRGVPDELGMTTSLT